MAGLAGDGRLDWFNEAAARRLGLPGRRDTATAPPVEPAPTPASLRETEHQAIAQALAEHGHNVSKAARALGVSRGRVYRHLRANRA